MQKDHISNWIKAGVVSFMVSAGAIFSAPVYAQTQPVQNNELQETIEDADEYSDEEVQKFVQAAEQVSSIMQHSESEMIRAINDQNLDIEKFNEIMAAQQGMVDGGIEVTPEELDAFSSAASKIIEIQEEMREEMQRAIAAQGMDTDKFQQMVIAYQRNPEFQNKIDRMIIEE
jgi:hypothetical protein